MHEYEEEARALHLYCRLFVQRVLWFVLDCLYGRYYAAALGEVRHGKSDADTDTNANVEPTRMRRERRDRGETWEKTSYLLGGLGMIR